jgi:hypothetical protein
MISVTIWHGRDFYDHDLPPTLYQAHKSVSEDTVLKSIKDHDKYVKEKTIPWYLIVVTRYTVGGECTTETHHKACAKKTKILLNTPAKRTGKSVMATMAAVEYANLVNPWANINADAPVFAPPQPAPDLNF